MALFRAIETARPKQGRLFYDPFAELFLDRGLKLVVKVSSIPQIGKIIPKILQMKAPGALSSGVARTAYIDDLLQHTINNGVEQVVILGVGFDTRALRLKFLEKIPVIEIDHPNTAGYKMEIIQNSMGKLPQNVKYYQIDFNQENLTDLAHKYDLNLDISTTFIWEGVTNYLSQEAVDKTFEFVKKFSKPSYVIFTYIDKQVLDHPDSFEGTEKYGDILEKNEERWTLGFDPSKLSDYLKNYDLKLIENLDAVSYREKYMSDRKNLLKGYEFYRVAMAKLD